MPSSTPRSWADLADAAVGVWGVGVEGRANLAKLEQVGVSPRAVVDDRPSSDGVLATAEGGLDALARCDVVVKAPGISRYGAGVRRLEAAGVAVVGGLGLWLEEVGPERVIGVTGTKGKSTTVAVAGHLAGRLGVRCAIGGNIGSPPWAEEEADVDLWIVEVSSYQATDLWSSPAVVGVTSLHADHLDWHDDDVETYVRDKLSLCGRPGARVTVANGHDERLRARAELLRPGPRWITDEQADAGWTDRLGLRGDHNRRNALLAAACLEEMGVAGAADPERLVAAAEGFEPLPHRLSTVAVHAGVEYVDDSLSTNVLPTVVAAEVFDGRPLTLLVGGFDRDIDYTPLADFVRARSAPTVVLTMPDNGERIRRTLADAGVEAVACRDLAHAVEEASVRTPAGGVVLLSPAAPSYGIYSSYKDRAQAFERAVREVAGRPR